MKLTVKVTRNGRPLDRDEFKRDLAGRILQKAVEVIEQRTADLRCPVHDAPPDVSFDADTQAITVGSCCTEFRDEVLRRARGGR